MTSVFPGPGVGTLSALVSALFSGATSIRSACSSSLFPAHFLLICHLSPSFAHRLLTLVNIYQTYGASTAYSCGALLAGVSAQTIRRCVSDFWPYFSINLQVHWPPSTSRSSLTDGL